MRTLNRANLRKPAAKKKPQTRGYRSFTDTLNLVYLKLYEADEPQSHLQIARLIGRKKKYPILDAVLKHMVNIAWAEQIESTSPTNGHLVYLYRALRYDKEGRCLNCPEPKE